jgi:class 3 adenylate cyclase
MAELPSGTVTFLFTDLEGSTGLWEEHPDAMQGALARHDELLRAAIEAHDGRVVKTTGDGVHAVFASVRDALDTAIGAQCALCAEPWEKTGPLRVRMGLHTGEAEQRGGDYCGSALNRAARIMSAGDGGQVLCSRPTADLAGDALPEGFAARSWRAASPGSGWLGGGVPGRAPGAAG